MAFSAPPRDGQLAGNWREAKWLASTKTRFYEIRDITLKRPPVSYTFCVAGVDPENIHKVTEGSDSELDNALDNIYAYYGPVDLQVRGCDRDGKYYVICSQLRHKHGPPKAVICVSPAKVEKGRTAAAKTEPTQPVLDGKVQEQEDWEQVVSHEVEVDDDWIKV